MKEAIYYNSNLNIINLIYFNEDGIVRVLSTGCPYFNGNVDTIFKILVEDGYKLIGYV